MREFFDQVIANGNFDLATFLRNVDCYHIEGKLTDDERTELYANARAAVKPEYDYNTEIAALWVEIRKLQNAVKELQNASGGSTFPETPTDEWPAYIQPTGGHDAYQKGDKISYNGKHYVCAIDNCVWNPDNYPAGWTEQ